MAKLSWSVVAVLLLCCAVVLAKNNSTTSPSPSPSPSPSHPKVSTSVPNPSNSSTKSTPAKTSTSTKKPVKPTSTPTPRPTTPPATHHNDTLYKLMTADGKKMCILLNATMHLLIRYNETAKGKTIPHFLNISVPDASYVNISGRCNSSLDETAKESVMKISWKNSTAQKNITLTFWFQADFSKGNQQWNLSNVTVFVPTGVLTNSSLNQISSLTSNSSYVIGNQDFKRAYLCQSNQNITFRPVHNVSMFLNTIKFASQAFLFTNSTSGELDEDSAARCAADVEGSKIVPIAVGAALAGLVIIVLIAYIIGRLRSRKTGSYEALS